MARKEARSLRSAQSKLSRSRQMVAILGFCTVIVVCLVIRNQTQAPQATAKAPVTMRNSQSRLASNRLAQNRTRSSSRPTASKRAAGALPSVGYPEHDVMAIVNRQDISRADLATAAIQRHGNEVLEAMVNKHLIMHHCRKRNIQITKEEITEEIDRTAKRFKIGRKQLLEMYQKKRGISPEEYARDIVWPTLALRKLAADRLQVNESEIKNEYEKLFGPKVGARIIVVKEKLEAEKILRELKVNSDEFARLAMQKSIDINSASQGGLIQPIHLHSGAENIENAAFSLRTNQVSGILQIGNNFAILKCERQYAASTTPLENVRKELVERIREEKIRKEAHGLFSKLQSSATIQKVLNNPRLSQLMPGVVATINGEQITMRELGKECVLRHGKEVLATEISYLLLRQELKKNNLQVTQQDLNVEIAHAAELAGVLTKAGKPNIKEWVVLATKEQGISKKQYIRDMVWPSAALKKITRGNVRVTTEDLAKGFEANYGERVRCRMIVFGNMRHAQEVWAKARQNQSIEFFGRLAKEYSVEPTSRALSGQIPPIRRNGGQSQVEKFAFQLKKGELSGIIAMDGNLSGKFCILMSEGRTQPEKIKLAEVQSILLEDLTEKRLRIAMSKKLESLYTSAHIENYLAQTSYSPAKRKAKKTTRRDPTVRRASGTR